MELMEGYVSMVEVEGEEILLEIPKCSLDETKIK
jgi:hypothetical protein